MTCMLVWWLVSTPIAVLGCWLMGKYQPGRFGRVILPFILFILFPGVLTILILLLVGFICGVPRISKWVNPYFKRAKGEK